MRSSKKTAPDGFTLVELMVVVAMVGVLAAVAIPNYMHFVAKARQTEAKVALAAIYTTETSFRAENGSYTACLKQAGYAPSGTNRYYLVGFSYSSVDGNVSCGPTGTSECGRYNFNLPNGTFQGSCNGSDPNHLAFPGPLSASDVAFSATLYQSNGNYYNKPGNWHLDALNTQISSGAFTAGAAGAISSNPAGSALLGEPSNVNSGHCCDGWTINQDKSLLNVAPGI